MAAVVVDTYTDPDSGKLVRVYESGVHQREDGRIIKPPLPERRGIRPDNAKDMARQRISKTRAALARAILENSKDVTGLPLAHPSDAVAAVGGMIWAQVAANPSAPARERVNAWETIAKHAGALGDLRAKEDNQPAMGVQLDAQTAQYLIDRLIEARKSGDTSG